MWRSLWFAACADIIIMIVGFIVVRTVSRSQDLIIDETEPGIVPYETLIRGRSYTCRPPRY